MSSSIKHTSIEILKRDSLHQGGFAGLKEHQLVKSPTVFGSQGNQDGSWQGLGQFVYLADARFMPHGETGMHPHHEVDVISIIVEGRISHQGSLEHGQDLLPNDVQIQRAGGEGFSHNEINPDNEWNRMIQLWVLPEQAGQAADYKVYAPATEKLNTVYGGGSDADFPAKTKVEIALLSKEKTVEVTETFIAYVTRGKGVANGEPVEEGDLIRGSQLKFIATNDVQLIVIH